MSQTMRYLPDGRIELVEQDVPDPGAQEVQVTGGACGICSWDLVTAKLGDQMHPMAPPGHEGVGYVSKVGTGVTGVKEGDRVAGGGFATVRNLSTNRLYKIPESELPDKYWIVEPVSCAVTGVDHCQIKGGDRIAVVGCGFMGLLILQGLLHHPLDQLIVIDVVHNRLDLAKQLGVDEVYNTTEIDTAELAADLKAREIDVVVDTSGNQGGLDLATDIVKRGGRINLFGWIKGKTATFDPTKWHMGGFTIMNSTSSAKIRDTFEAAIRMIHNGVFDLEPLVTHTATLEEYPDLMQGLVAGDPSYIKGVITLG